MLSFSTGAIRSTFQPDGLNGDINVTLWPIQVRPRLRAHSRGPSASPWSPPPCLSLGTQLFHSASLQNGTLHFCGFQVLAPQIFWCPAHSPHAARTAMLDGWRARLKGLMTEKPLVFAHTELFHLSFEKGFLIREDVRAQLTSEPFGLTTGHHLGKPLPPDNQLIAPPRDDRSTQTYCGK